MKQVKVTVTREWFVHGLSMADAITHCLNHLDDDPSRLKLVAHEVFDAAENA